MKRYLLFTILLGITLHAQADKKTYKNYFIKKEVYHHSFQNMGMIFSTEECKYDEEYNKILIYETKALEKGGTQGELYVQFKEYFKYDNQNRIVEKERFEFFKGNYRQDDKQTYIYDDKGNLAETIELNWNPDLNKYEKLEKHIYTYNNQGDLLSDTTVRATNQDIWRELFVDKYNYRDDLLKTVVRQYVETEGGGIMSRTTYSYDDRGNRVKSLEEKYQYNAWEELRKEEFTYDNDDNLQIRVSYLKSPRGWTPNFRYEPTKYNKKYLTKDTYSFSRTLGLFPSKNVVTAYNAYQYDSRLKKWQQLTRNNLVYDFDVRNTGVIEPVKDPSTGQTLKEKEGISVYPNPTTEFFSISTDESEGTLEIYDLSGKMVRYFDYLRDSYDVASLIPGVYVVVLNTKEGKETFKLMKQ